MVNSERENRTQTVPKTIGTRQVNSGSATSRLADDDFERTVWCLAGIPADISTIDQAVAAIDLAIHERRRLSFVTPNVNWLARAVKDPDVRQELINADLSLIDGAPLAAIARRLEVPIEARVAGSDLFEALRRRPAYLGKKLRVFFFGGRDGAAEAASNAVNNENGGIESAGWLNPGFGSVEDMSRPEIIASINDAEPDFVVVALGAGKGQRWIEANQSALNAPVIAHLGAVVDFTAGGIARAPKIVRRFGLEWAWRIKEEPSLWRRYAQDALALGGIFWSRILPQRHISAASEGADSPRAIIETSQKVTKIKMIGSFSHTNLRELRSVFRQAASENGDVILDFTNVGSFDRAFLGLVLMLEKHVVKRGAKLYRVGANGGHLKVLKANDMRYPSYDPATHDQTIMNAHTSLAKRVGGGV